MTLLICFEQLILLFLPILVLFLLYLIFHPLDIYIYFYHSLVFVYIWSLYILLILVYFTNPVLAFTVVVSFAKIFSTIKIPPVFLIFQSNYTQGIYVWLVFLTSLIFLLYFATKNLTHMILLICTSPQSCGVSCFLIIK